MRKECPSTTFFVRIFRIWTEYGEILRISPYSTRMQENKDQKNLRIWTLFMKRIVKKLDKFRKILITIFFC